MIKIRTKEKVSLMQAINFEMEQNQNGIQKTGMYSADDCYWELRVERPLFENGFRASVSWYQLQEYEIDAGQGIMGIRESRMFYEDFSMSKTEMKAMFDTVNMAITPNQDDPFDKWLEIVAQGVLHWVGVQREIFGLGVEDFEIV